MTTTDKKLTDAEIIKAFTVCITSEDCSLCPMFRNCPTSFELQKQALDLINRQQEMIDGLIAGQETLQKALADKQAEIDRLQHILVSFMSEVERWEYKYGVDTSRIPQIAILGTEKGSIIKHIASEAIKEFAERLKEKVESYDVYDGYKITIRFAVEEDTIDNLVKEMG